MNFKKYITILFLLPFISGFCQTEFKLVKEVKTTATDFTTDNLNKIYLIDNNEIFKLNYQGDTLYTYSNKTLGTIEKLDVTNTLRPLIFFKENESIVVTDNTLSAQQAAYNLQELNLYQTQLIATSLVDNGVWIYDQELFQLIKVNTGFERIYESGNLEQILRKDSLSPTQLLEFDRSVYLNCPNDGILVFDVYGSYIKTIPILNAEEIQVTKNAIYYKRDSSYYIYRLVDFEERKIELPIEKFTKVRFEKNHLIISSLEKISIYLTEDK